MYMYFIFFMFRNNACIFQLYCNLSFFTIEKLCVHIFKWMFSLYLQTVDLISGGSKINVTNENKKDYLNALANYRLSVKVKNEVEAFLKGVNEIVPEELLSIFDENELEVIFFSIYSKEFHMQLCYANFMTIFKSTIFSY